MQSGVPDRNGAVSQAPYRGSVHGKGAAAIDAATLAAESVRSIEQFKHWARTTLREIFPHEAFVCGYGHLHAGGVALDYALTVDYPASYLQGLRNRAGAIDTPVLRRWLAVRKPLLLEACDPWPDLSTAWLDCFRAHDLRNIVAHGVYDAERCRATYYTFSRIPGRLGEAHAHTVAQVVPVMHAVLCRLIDSLRHGDAFAARLAGLSRREAEIAQLARLGNSNGEIAALSRLSENTVKHHLTRIFEKLGVQNRSQLLHRFAEHEAEGAPFFGTKVL